MVLALLVVVCVTGCFGGVGRCHLTLRNVSKPKPTLESAKCAQGFTGDAAACSTNIEWFS